MRKEPRVEATYCEQDDILDTNIDVDEVEFAIWCLKRNCAEGLDLISSEHLKFTGPVFRNLLCQDTIISHNLPPGTYSTMNVWEAFNIETRLD